MQPTIPFLMIDVKELFHSVLIAFTSHLIKIPVEGFVRDSTALKESTCYLIIFTAKFHRI